MSGLEVCNLTSTCKLLGASLFLNFFGDIGLSQELCCFDQGVVGEDGHRSLMSGLGTVLTLMTCSSG
jgi:hypothetical protein